MEIDHDWQTGKYSVEVKHTGLQKYRLISGSDRDVIEKKAHAQNRQWEAQWQKQLALKEQRRAKEAKAEERECAKATAVRSLKSKEARADRLTEEAQDELKAVENLLLDALKKTPILDLDALKKDDAFLTGEFSEPEPTLATIQLPKLRNYPPEPGQPANPPRPDPGDHKYAPVFSLLDKLFRSRKQRAVEAAEKLYSADLEQWEQRCEETHQQYKQRYAAWEQKKVEIETQNLEKTKKFEERTHRAQAAFDAKLISWKQQKTAFEERQKAAAEAFNASQCRQNQNLQKLKLAYSKRDPESIAEYSKLVLLHSPYALRFRRKCEVEYASESKLLIVEYSFPTIDDLPRVSEVVYEARKNQFKQSHLSESALNKMYDDTLYKITLRSLHELFKSDRVKAIESIAFNGWVNAVNRGTGKKVNTCVLSVHTKRETFLDIDLRKVEPKACFKLLKGVGSSSLHGLASIAPIMRIDRKDKRFVDAYAVAGDLDGSTNLAAMHWEDFEHLVRELFEKEFAKHGGEVKITQASRDGGVDAVAFDPDPIRGGKIVIQAKRYTNVVGLSAVRDLYGTVVNEGAIKGILVTTATYGPDAYDFAKDKPLTLLTGSHLLHMLEQHGHKAKIDLREAKRILSDANRESIQ